VSRGFYERLSLREGATRDEVKAAYRRSLGDLVGRLRQAQRSGADTAVLEAQRRDLDEAHEVLSAPARRRRYDHFRQLSREDPPSDPETFWAQVSPGWTDPAAAAAVDVIRSLTGLPVGDTFGTPTQHTARRATAPAHAPPAVSMMSSEQRQQRAQAAVAAVPEPEFQGPPDEATTPPPVARALSADELRGLAESFGYDGRYLKAVREARGARLDDIALATKIATRYLKAIEENAFEKLPAAVFVKGYVREIADYLEIDSEAVVAGYLVLFSRQRG
jgi:hypothetical protein